MIPFPIQQAIEITGGAYRGPDALVKESFTSVSIDTRTLVPGALYVPVKGDVLTAIGSFPTPLKRGPSSPFPRWTPPIPISW